MLRPGTAIQTGVNDPDRQGAICAFVEAAVAPGYVLLMAPYHVLAGNQKPSKVIVRTPAGEVIGEYRRAEPFGKDRNVDMAFAYLYDDFVDEYTNEIRTGRLLQNVMTPNPGQRLRTLAPLSNSQSGGVVDVGDGVVGGERHSVLIQSAPGVLQNGDSGSPWFTPDTSALVGMHLGKMDNTSGEYSALWLERVFDLYGLALL